ncbi:MAG: IS1634 family transposase [Nanoarchaeota archaeon]
MENTGYESQELAHLGIIAGICFEIELIKEIDSIIESGERGVTIGEAVQAMILNAMGFVNKPLYLTPQFFANKPVENLIRVGLTAEELNDDTLGRALDALYAKGVTEVFAKVASHACSIYGIEHAAYHLDSTSFAFEGEYNPEENSQAIKIVRGYSRDYRPDLKQAVLSLICSYKTAIPMWMEVHDGNEVDKVLFPQIINRYLEQMQQGEEPYFIADSALYVEANLARLSEQVLWLTRVPETIGLAKKLVIQTDPQAMEDADDAGYKWQEFGIRYGGVNQRWLVIYTQSGYEREEKSLLKRIAKEAEAAHKQILHLQAKRFFSDLGARLAAEELEQSWAYHTCVITVESVRHYRNRRGRPGVDTQPTEVTYKVKLLLSQAPGKIAFAKKSLGKYIIATNQLDGEKMPCSKMLGNYKDQPASVERGFRFLKDPMFFASGMFLKKPERIMALIMIMCLSLLVYSLAERKLRRALADNDETIPNQVGKPVPNPTLRWVFQIFQGIHVLIIKELNATRQLILNLTPLHRRIIRLLGVEVEKCYFYPR